MTMVEFVGSAAATLFRPTCIAISHKPRWQQTSKTLGYLTLYIPWLQHQANNTSPLSLPNSKPAWKGPEGAEGTGTGTIHSALSGGDPVFRLRAVRYKNKSRSNRVSVERRPRVPLPERKTANKDRIQIYGISVEHRAMALNIACGRNKTLSNITIFIAMV